MLIDLIDVNSNAKQNQTNFILIMSTIKQNFKQYFKGITIIHLALLGGQISFAAITVFLNQVNGAILTNKGLESNFLILIPVFAFGSFMFSQFIIPKQLIKCRNKELLNSKLEGYKTTQIIKFGLLEVSAFFPLVAYLLFGNYLFLGFAGLLIILFATYFPSKEKLVRELELNKDEQTQLDDDALIMEFKQYQK